MKRNLQNPSVKDVLKENILKAVDDLVAETHPDDKQAKKEWVLESAFILEVSEFWRYQILYLQVCFRNYMRSDRKTFKNLLQCKEDAVREADQSGEGDIRDGEQGAHEWHAHGRGIQQSHCRLCRTGQAGENNFQKVLYFYCMEEIPDCNFWLCLTKNFQLPNMHIAWISELLVIAFLMANWFHFYLTFSN